MTSVLFIFFTFDLGWRGYGWRSHLMIVAVFTAIMTIYTYFTTRPGLLGTLFTSYLEMALLFEVLFVLPGWGLGAGARRLFGGGKPYSLKMSFDV
jgi:hypothetical protein